mmetsp:Transcript_9069/g.32038  ORF Transcript_9069/g.32038 Transcript_9069/m.32038 type:complete len:302 (-) Transcript_9069:81-986(-)
MAGAIESPEAQVKFIEDAASSTGLAGALGTLATVVHYVASIVIVAGAVIGYIPQYRAIARSQNADGFSTLVSLILIVSNTTRVFFWFGRDFEVTLLYQAVAVVACQLAMIQLCTRVRVATQRADKRLRRFTDFNVNEFWTWDDFASYVQAEASLVGLLVAFSIAFMRYEWFVDALGTLALGVEALLGVPQIYRNFVKQSTAGLSLAMIVSWFAGDAFKTVYFLGSGAPAQFLYCGMFQLMCDSVILYQMFVAYAHEKNRVDVTSWCKARFLRRWVRRLVNPRERVGSDSRGGSRLSDASNV